jgi:hypothetical protein
MRVRPVGVKTFVETLGRKDHKVKRPLCGQYQGGCTHHAGMSIFSIGALTVKLESTI